MCIKPTTIDGKASYLVSTWDSDTNGKQVEVTLSDKNEMAKVDSIVSAYGKTSGFSAIWVYYKADGTVDRTDFQYAAPFKQDVCAPGDKTCTDAIADVVTTAKAK